jgi:DNA-binding NtrC family response regulator
MDSKKTKAIIIEKNHAFRDFLRSAVSDAGALAYCFQSENTCLDNIAVLEPDLIVVGSLSRERMIQFLNALRAIECKLPVLIISEDRGVWEYVEVNGFAGTTIIDTYARLSEFANIFQAAVDKKAKNRNWEKIPFIVGNDPDIIKIKKALPQLSQSNDSILIKGENGVGKEMLARAIHLNSRNKKELFIKINASALSSEKTSWRLVDFFTEHVLNGKGDSRRRKNLVNGTLYFDEICDIPDALQAELLLVETQNSPSMVNPDLNGINNFRIIAGTEKNIDKLLEKNEFRKDLYYRMNVFDLNIPPLRDRRDDIPLLTDFFAYKVCRIYKKSYFELSKEIKSIFQKYHWPGNIRELENAVKRAVMIRDERKFLSDFYLKNGIADVTGGDHWFDSPTSIDELIDPKDYVRKIDNMSLKDICWDCLASVEKNIMKKALDNTNWNRKKAACMLNISYKSMLNKIKEYGLA